MYCYNKRSRSTKVFQIVPNNQETSPSPVQLQKSDTIETKNEDLNNDVLEFVTDDNMASPSLTIMTDFNSDISNDTTRSSSATTASSTDGEVCIVYIVHCLQYSIIGHTTPKVIF